MDLLAEYNDSSGSEHEGVSHAGGSKVSAPAPAPTLLRAPRLGVAGPASSGPQPTASSAVGSSTSSSASSSSTTLSLLPGAGLQGPGTALSLRQAAAAVSTTGAKLTAVGTFQHEAIDRTVFDMQQHARTQQVVTALATGEWSGPAAGPRPSAYATAVARAAHAASAGAPAPSGPAGAPAVKRVKVLHGSSDAGDIGGWCGPWTSYEGERGDRTTALAKGVLTDAQKKAREAQGYNPDRAGKKGEEGTSVGPAWGAAQVGDAVAEGAGVVLSIGDAPSSAAGGAFDERTGDFVPGNGGALAGTKRPRADGGSLPAAAPARPSSAAAASSESKEGSSSGAGPGMAPSEATSKFHGKEETDYQGRSWLAVPKGVHPDGGAHACHAPKRLAYRFLGHSKGVQSIEFFPGTGHMLLSGSMDTKIKIWDMGMSAAGAGVPRTVRRTYAGHTGSVRQVRFNGDGSRFLSASYDKSVKEWDAETGACLLSLDPGGIPYTAVYCPTDNRSVLVGSSNRKVMQFDTRTGECVLEYNYHLNAVNSITFFDEGRRIATTSDDKSVLVWDYNTPVPIKYLTDPSAPNIPVMALHPGGQAMAAQCMDNTIAVYHAGERFALDRKRRFTGHVTAGFACGLTFSPDGRFLASGDGDGNFHLWEWGSGAFVKKTKAHDDGPCIGIAWHPLLPTTVATCGWDGTIKVWE